MWKKRYLSYNHNDDIVNKVQNPNEEPAEKSPDVKSAEVISAGYKMENELVGVRDGNADLNIYRYRASIKDGHLLENRVGSLIVTHIHSRPGMEQEQPLDLSLAESDYNRGKTPLDVQKMFPDLKQTTTGTLVLWNFLWAILENNHTNIAAWISDSADKKFKIVNPDLLAETWGAMKGSPEMQWTKIKKILDLYVRKKLIQVCSEEEYLFMFLIVPK